MQVQVNARTGEIRFRVSRGGAYETAGEGTFGVGVARWYIDRLKEAVTAIEKDSSDEFKTLSA